MKSSLNRPESKKRKVESETEYEIKLQENKITKYFKSQESRKRSFSVYEKEDKCFYKEYIN